MTNTRTDGQILRSRGIGAGVGALIGAGWMVFGLKTLPMMTVGPLALLSVGAVGWLVVGASRLVAASRLQPVPDAEAQRASRLVWGLFWLNFLGEIVLLNVAVNLLAAPALRVFWIPAISLVVGLHFLPMAWFFRVPSYHLCGAAMIGAAAIATVALRTQCAPPVDIIAGEAIGNAAILWLTAAWAIWTTKR